MTENFIDPRTVFNIMRENPVEISDREQPLRGFVKEFFIEEGVLWLTNHCRPI